MEHEKLVERLFQNSIAAKIDCVETVTPVIVRAGQLMAECLLSDRKILVCGDASGLANAQYLANILMFQGERERPGLPCILLDATGCGSLGAGLDYGDSEMFARQVNALGQPGDVMVVFTHAGTSAAIGAAIRAAHDRDMVVVALTAQTGGNVPALLDHRDVEVRVPITSRFRTHEIHLLLSFALCELVEWQLFGGE